MMKKFNFFSLQIDVSLNISTVSMVLKSKLGSLATIWLPNTYSALKYQTKVQFNQTCLGRFGEGVWRDIAKPWTVVDYYVDFGPLSASFLGVKPVYIEPGVRICQVWLHQGVDWGQVRQVTKWLNI